MKEQLDLGHGVVVMVDRAAQTITLGTVVGDVILASRHACLQLDGEDAASVVQGDDGRWYGVASEDAYLGLAVAMAAILGDG